ncbi:MAG TPA: YcaO-like family protein [Candidatus Baltobacteraceae bacterium]|nr:YcaO-like family protein [Candidatus Baltobacteraceae bacterium]
MVDPEAGIILRASLSRKPLWFSDIKFASAFSNQWPGLVAALREERARPTERSREARSAFWKPSSVSVGVGYDTDSALIRAIAEGVERFCAQIIDRKRHVFRDASYAEMAAEGLVLPIEDYQVLTDEQITTQARLEPETGKVPVRKLTPDDQMTWVLVRELTENKPAYVPILNAFLGVRPPRHHDRIIEQISTGTACHGTWEAAVLSGLCEVIERDAFVGMWLRRLSPPRVSLESLRSASAVLDRMVGEFSRTTIKLHVNDLTANFGVPTFVATATHDRPPYAVVGAGTHPDAAIAAEKAIYEVLMAVAGYVESTYLSENWDFWKVLPEGKILSDHEISHMKDHSELYVKNDLRSRLDFYLTAPEVEFRGQTYLGDRHGGDPGAMLDFLIATMRNAGYPVFVNDLTIDEVDRLGLKVVKVFVPRLLPLYCREANKPLGCARLWQYERIFPQLHVFDEPLNPWAHPFP